MHKAILEVDKELSLPPFSAIPFDLLVPQALKNLLQINRVLVKKYRKGFVCIGNLKMYKVASHILSSNEEIPVIIESRRFSPEKIRNLYLAELYLYQIVYGLSTNDVRCLFKALQNLPENTPSPIPKCRNSEFANAMRISNRSLYDK